MSCEGSRCATLVSLPTQMDMNMTIPAPKTKDNKTVAGYDIPRDTISKEFIKNAKTARQSLESNNSCNNGLSDYLIPCTSTKLVPESPRIVITSPDDDPLPSPFHGTLKTEKEVFSRMNQIQSDAIETPRPADHSFLLAVAIAVGVVLIVFLLVFLFFQID
ncbi:hypothetical protein RB195_009223 [Necator americanus]|uniref:Uncharacterized protein n=1 Tax=Necator americanus TaxID=51031 RepID=A0ABR1CSC4_NECAM